MFSSEDGVIFITVPQFEGMTAKEHTWTRGTWKCVHRRRKSIIPWTKKGFLLCQNGHILLSHQVWKSLKIKETVSLGSHHHRRGYSNMFDGRAQPWAVVLALTYHRKKCEFRHVGQLDHMILHSYSSAMFVGPGFVPLGWKLKNSQDTMYLQCCKVRQAYKAPHSLLQKVQQMCNEDGPSLSFDQQLLWFLKLCFFTLFLLLAPLLYIHTASFFVLTMYTQLIFGSLLSEDWHECGEIFFQLSPLDWKHLLPLCLPWD